MGTASTYLREKLTPHLVVVRSVTVSQEFVDNNVVMYDDAFDKFGDFFQQFRLSTPDTVLLVSRTDHKGHHVIFFVGRNGVMYGTTFFYDRWFHPTTGKPVVNTENYLEETLERVFK